MTDHQLNRLASERHQMFRPVWQEIDQPGRTRPGLQSDPVGQVQGAAVLKYFQKLWT
uniref:Uncharacterized protein n=1 Tax=Hyaloperonospora arabidopsidis (strain Emoy2) TaxID=559515 RepID=M4BLD3_HYAAE